MMRWRMRRVMCGLGLHVFDWGGHYLIKRTPSMNTVLACHWCTKTINGRDVSSGTTTEAASFPLGCVLVGASLALMKSFHPASLLFGLPVLLLAVVGLTLQSLGTLWLIRRNRYFKHLTSAERRRGDRR